MTLLEQGRYFNEELLREGLQAKYPNKTLDIKVNKETKEYECFEV